jgi:phosphatidylinositol alpha-1,6-mannosyltransferase
MHKTGVRAHAAPDSIRFLVTADSFLPHSGGSRVYYANLYRNLIERYPDTITLLTKKVLGWREFDAHESNERFKISRHFTPLPHWKYWQLPKALPQFIHAATTALIGRYDCLHCCDLFPQALNGVFLSRIFNLPLIIFCHGDEISQTDRRRFQPRVRDFVYRQADAIVAANQYAWESLVRIGIPKDRIHKLTPGVDLQSFQPRARNKQLIDRFGLAGEKVVLTVARLVPRKGHAIVLRALPAVLDRIPNLKYLIVGEGPEKERLEKIVSDLRLDKIVTFVGDVSHHQIAEFYNLCDVFIMTNRLEEGGDIESFGMVFTEANAMCKPVIGGKSGGTAEAVLDGKTGFLVDPDSAPDVAERLLLLLSSETLSKRMGSAGLNRVIQEFSWKTRSDALRQVSADLIMKRRRPGISCESGSLTQRRSKASY